MDIKKSVKKSKAIKFEITNGKRQIGRAYLYIIRNDLHKRPYGLLEDLYVDEKFRGQGLGKAILLAVVKEVKKRKLYKLIGTSRKSRFKVHKFYEKHGFARYGIEFRMDL